jgi:hypothetical protein
MISHMSPAPAALATSPHPGMDVCEYGGRDHVWCRTSNVASGCPGRSCGEDRPTRGFTRICCRATLPLHADRSDSPRFVKIISPRQARPSVPVLGRAAGSRGRPSKGRPGRSSSALTWWFILRALWIRSTDHAPRARLARPFAATSRFHRGVFPAILSAFATRRPTPWWTTRAAHGERGMMPSRTAALNTDLACWSSSGQLLWLRAAAI